MGMMIEVTPDGQPIPGRWYTDYTDAWRKAFPGSVDKPGFFLGSFWHTHTSSWDAWWFSAAGVVMPSPCVEISPLFEYPEAE